MPLLWCCSGASVLLCSLKCVMYFDIVFVCMTLHAVVVLSFYAYKLLLSIVLVVILCYCCHAVS